MSVYPVVNVDVYISSTWVSTTGGLDREREENRRSRLQEVLWQESKAIEPLVRMRVIATEGYHRESQGNKESGLHGVLDRVRIRQGKGDVDVIRVNPSTIV